MAPQLSYSIDLPAVSFPGQPADLAMKDALTGLAVAAALPYGVLVVKDLSNTSGFKLAAKLPSASTDITVAGSILGVVMADQARSQDPSVATAQYPRYSAVPAMRYGRIWVQVEEAVVAGDQAFARFASGAGGTQLGAFRKSADTATAAAVPNAYYVSSQTTIGGYAVLEVQFV